MEKPRFAGFFCMFFTMRNLFTFSKYDNMPIHYLTKTNMGNKRGGLFFGVIVGTLLGILFAPRKGKELRKQLKDEVSKGGMGTETLKKNFTEMGHDIADTAEEVYNMPEVQEQVVKGKKQVDKMMLKAEGHVSKAEQKVRDLSEKYLDLDEEKVDEITHKIHKAGQKVHGKLQNFRQKFMGDVGFTKKPISKSKSTSQPKKKSGRTSSKKRTRKVNIKRKG